LGPIANPERETSFTSGADTLYGSLIVPSHGPGRIPGALIISGSGPTDRNGNNVLLPGEVNSNLNFARALANLGVASLRYDKLGTGATGLASYAGHLQDIDFDVFVDEARAAYEHLGRQPDVDPRRLIVLGHSEGGLIALLLATQVRGANAPRGLVLAAPLGAPYLDTIRRQLTEQYAAAQQAGAVTPGQAAAALAELDAVIAHLQETGEVPDAIATPALRVIFSRANQRFLAQVGAYDPAALAASLPPTLPVLIMRGTKDQQVSLGDVQHLFSGFLEAGNARTRLVQIPNADHVFKDVPGVPNAAVDYVNPALPFSAEAVQQLAAFVQAP
jgi:alpha-beta hydrolase superfamily lysophospholipase